MERNALNELVKWHNKPNRKPLIVWGARQVGKTYLIKDMFAEKYYQNNYIYIDFNAEDEIREICGGTANADKIIETISMYKNKPINKDTLLIFDEIQEYPNIVSSLKYFCQDHREIPVIATGSMVRIKLLRESKKRGSKKNTFLFPVGKINQINISPLTFDEYLMNANTILYEHVKKSYESKKALDAGIHQLAMDEFYRFLLLGGMPEVVDTYLKTKDMLSAREVLNEIYDDYLADMQLYQASSESIVRTRAVFAKIFDELNKESKNFSSKMIQEGTKIRDYKSPIEWLHLSHLVNVSKQLKERVTIPLNGDEESLFRLYLSDMGVFTYQSKVNAATFIAKDANNMLAGVFFENYVAIELMAHNIDLYYWKGKNRYELEFIVESNGELYPIDAKKNKGSLASLDEFVNHNKYKLAIKVSANNYGYNKEKRLLTIPYYYMPFVAEDLSKGTLKAE